MPSSPEQLELRLESLVESLELFAEERRRRTLGYVSQYPTGRWITVPVGEYL